MNNKNTFRKTEISDRNLSIIDKLTADEEKDLSIRIHAGEKAKKELSQNKTLSEMKQQALQKKVDYGNEAFERMVLANLPRAIKTAAETYRKNQLGLNEFEDYKQVALMVICKCARTYDWKLGCRFGTYVHRSLIHEMMRENAKNGYAIRIPEEYLPAISGVNRTADMEVCDDLPHTDGVSDTLSAACKVPRSLHASVSQDDADTELGDMISDPSVLTSEEIGDMIDREEQIRKAKAAFASLSENERILLSGRLGLDGDKLPMKAFVGTAAKTISGVQKKQLAAEKHLREIYFSLPMSA